MLFHLIRWFWSLSNKLNLYLLVDGQGVGWEWLMVKTVFSGWAFGKMTNLPYIEISICHKRTHYKMARFKSTWISLSREILPSQTHLVLNICIFQNYGLGRYSKRIWLHLRHTHSRKNKESEFILPSCKWCKLS